MDTPGFGDSDNDDNNLMNEMIEILKNIIKTANGFVLLFNGQSERFDTKAQQMIREMEALFGQGFWNHVILGVSFWHYDENSIMARNFSGKTESWWTTEMNTQLKDKFNVDKELEAVFIDSWAKQEWNLDDNLQQEAFSREASKLWNIFSNNSKFEFKTIEDIIEELNECKLENDCLNGKIQQQISNLTSQMTILKTELEQEKAKNKEQDDAISDMELSSLPLGSIIPWINRPAIDTIHHEDLPEGWVICNGTIIPKGVWSGEKTPNLNGEGRFLRGGAPHLVLNMEDHMVQDHTHIDNGHTHEDAGHSHPYEDCGQGIMTIDGHDYPAAANNCVNKASHISKANIQKSKVNMGGIESGHSGNETRPINMRVIWIMKAW